MVLTPNIKSGDMVLVDGKLRAVPAVPVTLDSNGKLNGNTGIQLLADDPSLGLNNPLQYKVTVTKARQRGFPQPVKEWSILAGASGATVDLADEPPAVGVPAVGTRGPRTKVVPVTPGDPDTLYQWTDEYGKPFGDPVPLTSIISEAVAAAAAANAAPEAVTADLESRGIGFVDQGGGQGYFTVGGAQVSGTLVPPAAVLSGVVVTADDGQDTVVADGKLVTKNPLFIDPTQAPYFVKADRRTFATASMSSTTNPTHLTVTGYTFTADDIGKHVKVVGAAAAGANLKTTIVGVSSGKAVLNAPASITVTNGFCIVGTDNHNALQMFFDDISHTGAQLGRCAVFGAGAIMFSGTIYLPYAATVKGATENWDGQDLFWGRSSGAELRQCTAFYQMWDQNVDAFRVKKASSIQQDWVGKLDGFLVIQDLDNTAGHGISFRDEAGNPVSVIDGGSVQRICVSGAPQAGFDFARGVVGNASFRDLAAWGCGYMDRVVFTADTTSGSSTLTNVSSFTGLRVGGVVSGPGIPVDAVILSMNTGAGTMVVRYAATTTATGLAMQQAGSAGVRYYLYGAETVHFDMISGDQNSGGTLHLVGSVNTGGPSAIVVTSLKNEFTVNAYRESYNQVTANPSVPQGANAIVTEYAANARITIRGLSHWAGATSSVGGSTPNSMGRHLGAAILDVATSGVVGPDVTWEGALIRLATGSGQTELVVMRDSHSANLLPLTATKGTNKAPTRTLRTAADVNVTLSAHDSVVAYTSLTGAHVVTLPPSSVIPQVRELLIADWSGSASTTNTITAAPTGADTIVGDTAVNHPLGQLSLIWNGTAWVGRATRAPNLSGSAVLDFPTVGSYSHQDLPMTVTGAVIGDAVLLVPAHQIGGIIYTALVTATNTVTVRARNYTAGGIDPPSGTFKAVIIR